MNGGVVFMGHQLTRLHFPLEVDYLHVTRYRGRTHGGALSWQRKPELPLNDRAVLIVWQWILRGISRNPIRLCCAL